MQIQDKILGTGATGLAGSAIVRALINGGYQNIIGTFHSRSIEKIFPDESYYRNSCRFIKIDLLRQQDVENLINEEKPAYVFLAAARVGGIMANHLHRAQFIYENLQIQNNVIHSSYLAGVKKLCFLGSTCIYPAQAPQPMKEEYLLTDKLEYLSEPYGVAKIAGIKMCESYNIQYGTNFLSIMPTNLFGLNDNYDLLTSHFLPAFIRKMHLGKLLMSEDWEGLRSDLEKNPIADLPVTSPEEDMKKYFTSIGVGTQGDGENFQLRLWGSGNPRREVLYADEFAAASIHVMKSLEFDDLVKASVSNYSVGAVREEIRNTQINVGLGYDLSLKEIAELVKKVTGFEGEIIWDKHMPDGTMQKLTDVEKLSSLGWKSALSLEEGIAATYKAYQNN